MQGLSLRSIIFHRIQHFERPHYRSCLIGRGWSCYHPGQRTSTDLCIHVTGKHRGTRGVQGQLYSMCYWQRPINPSLAACDRSYDQVTHSYLSKSNNRMYSIQTDPRLTQHTAGVLHLPKHLFHICTFRLLDCLHCPQLNEAQKWPHSDLRKGLKLVVCSDSAMCIIDNTFFKVSAI